MGLIYQKFLDGTVKSLFEGLPTFVVQREAGADVTVEELFLDSLPRSLWFIVTTYHPVLLPSNIGAFDLSGNCAINPSKLCHRLSSPTVSVWKKNPV